MSGANRRNKITVFSIGAEIAGSCPGRDFSITRQPISKSLQFWKRLFETVLQFLLCESKIAMESKWAVDGESHNLLIGVFYRFDLHLLSFLSFITANPHVSPTRRR